MKTISTHSVVFYLPQDFNIGNIETHGFHCEQNYVGLCAVASNVVKLIGGFDEYFMVWGAEDDDFYNRLSLQNIERVQLLPDKYLIYHQWHKSHAPGKPSPWYLTMVNHLFHKSKSNPDDNFGYLINRNDRKVLELLTDSNRSRNKQLHFWADSYFLFFNSLIRDVSQLDSGEVAWLEYTHHEPTKLRGLMHLVKDIFLREKKKGRI